jgi:hypothetical protein
MAQQAPRVVSSVPPEALAIFQREMKARNVDLDLYEVRFRETDDTYIIYTHYKDNPKGLRGSDPRHPDFSVVVSRSELTLVRVSGAR